MLFTWENFVVPYFSKNIKANIKGCPISKLEMFVQGTQTQVKHDTYLAWFYSCLAQNMNMQVLLWGKTSC